MTIELWGSCYLAIRRLSSNSTCNFKSNARGRTECFKASELWQYVQRKTLTTNTPVRVLGDIPFENFAKQLLLLGDGKFPTESASDLISIPSHFYVSVPSLKELMRYVFQDSSNKYKYYHWLCERAIVTPKNEKVNKINDIILKKLPENSITCKSVDG
ncbi:hypothetical protein AVEN_262133-1 [Araneus ventricosus]|uniref:Uncharacterized protein n=1 Tax=Araneus ventricosus TaxID=182803 RepID=A0A4Y2EAV3_ARAVE|nr:hypothetical protein AVEN_262133-1 [Araneus ventricosus]